MQTDTPRITLKSGHGKRDWYGFYVNVGHFQSELIFIDKIHFDYLSTIAGTTSEIDDDLNFED